MIIENEPNEAYHINPAISSTEAKLYLECPRLMKDKLDGIYKYKSTSAFELGTIYHRAVLEKEERFADVAVRPEGLKLNTKEGIEWKSKQSGKVIVKHEEIEGLKHSLNRMPDEIAEIFSIGKPETTIRVDNNIDKNGPQWQCRPDWLVDDCIYDLKSIDNYNDIDKHIAKFGYYISCGWYRAVYRLDTGRFPRFFKFIFCEKKPPYRWAIRSIDTFIWLGEIDAKIDSLFNEITYSHLHNYWPDESTLEEVVMQPEYMEE